MIVCAVGAMQAVCVLQCDLLVPSAPVADKNAGILQVCRVAVGTRKTAEIW